MSVEFSYNDRQAVLCNGKLYFFVQADDDDYFDYDIFFLETYTDVYGRIIRNYHIEQHGYRLRHKHSIRIPICDRVVNLDYFKDYKPVKIGIYERDDDGEKIYTGYIPIIISDQIPH